MPLHLNTLFSSGARIWVWHATETELELKKFIKEEDFFNISKIYTHPLRRIQKIITSLLIEELGAGQIIDLEYSESGKPAARNFPGHISISHTKQFVGLLYHPLYSCGLDLEQVDARVLKIAPKFLNEVEKTWIRSENNLEDTALIWSIKESLFKNIGGGGILFKEQLEVEEPLRTSLTSGDGLAVYKKLNQVKTFKYHYEYLEAVLLVHTIAIETIH